MLGRSVGVAPEATWIGCVNLARNLGNPPRYLDCLQFMLAPFPPAGDPAVDGRRAGCERAEQFVGLPGDRGCDAGALLPAVRALRAAGVFVVASAGNDGAACASITAPIGLYDEVFTVGAVDSDGRIARSAAAGRCRLTAATASSPTWWPRRRRSIVLSGRDVRLQRRHFDGRAARGWGRGPLVVGRPHPHRRC